MVLETLSKQEITWPSHLSLQACLFPTPQGCSRVNYALFSIQKFQVLNNMYSWIRIPLVSLEIEYLECSPDASDTFLKSDAICN